MFTVTINQNLETELTTEEAYQALSLFLLPKVKHLWESWVESGLLMVEDGEGGRRWQVNGARVKTESEEQES